MAAASDHLMVSENALDGLLFEDKASALLVTVYSNERPTCGLAGELDWRFQGAVSRAIRIGAITGKEGELTYIPLRRGERQFHFFFLGLGTSEEPGRRISPNASHWNKISKSVAGLKVGRLGISQKDVAAETPEAIAKALKGVPVWVIP